MTTALVVLLALTAWTLLAFPLAVVVGRLLARSADLTSASEFHTLEA
jgi:hypothetical protein